MSKGSRRVATGVLVALALTPWSSGAAELTGRQITEKVYNRDDGKDSHSKMEMTLVDKKGGERKRDFEIKSKDNGDLVNTYIEFTSPADISGTKFLTIEKKGEDDLQYLFLPALGRARRIVGGQKDQSFVNTDFTYEDMSRRVPEKDNQKLLREETVNGFACYVVESNPIDKGSSQYDKSVVWVDKNSFVAVKVDFYDKKSELCKQLTVRKLEKKSEIWTVTEVIMENLKKKTSTTLKMNDIQYNKGVDDAVFTVRRLEEKS